MQIAIVGAGLAGLSSAAILAKAGLSVTVLEKAHDIGGRAITRDYNGFCFNLGPHALYRGGVGYHLLTELGISLHGGIPDANGYYGLRQGQLHKLPSSPISLMTTGLVSWQAKTELMRFYPKISRLDPAMFHHLTWGEWVNTHFQQPETRALFVALGRFWTYAASIEQSASVVLQQAQLAMEKNVLYLDNGWQTLVDGLCQVAEHHGAVLKTGVSVSRLDESTLHLSTGETLVADTVILATPPDGVRKLVPEFTWQGSPVRAATLDIGLSRLPNPRYPFALGIDEPLYFSVHSAYAQLAPRGQVMLHAAKYLVGEHDTKQTEHQLEAMLDTIQPGWRHVCLTRRYLPNMTVSHAIVTPNHSRPKPQLRSNLYIAGDWVGDKGLLADAAFASAQQVAEQILAEARVSV